MDYRYKDTIIAVPREYAITRNWLYKVKGQTIFVLEQEFLMSTLYWIACHVDMKILRPSMNNVHILQRRVKYRNLFDIWRSTLKIGAAQDSLFLYRIPKFLHYRLDAWTEALSDMAFVPAQKLSGIL